jgi:protocatechuate 3,4-dioxygenase, alpha subunit
MSDDVTRPPRLRQTPGQTVGPFFHYALPYARGEELVAPSRAGSLRLHGTVFDGRGAPVPDALVEIRQADSAGQVPAVEGSLRRDGMTFTGWGRASTDTSGRYAFTTVEPGRAASGGTPFFSVVVFARGLLNRLFTRIYLPEVDADADALLSTLPPDRRDTLISSRQEDGSLRFDIHLQGDLETVFLTFPGHAS